jgi:adenylate kinase
MLNIILFGPPGAGKGTQSQFLREKYNLTYISTGEILREEIAAESELGLQVKEIISQGNLVSDEIVAKIIEKKLSENMDSAGFLFDGYPRTVDQVAELDAILADLGAQLDGVLLLVVDDREELVQRMIKRAATSGRTDDTEEVIRRRQDVYNAETAALVPIYRERGLLRAVDGIGDIDEIAARIDAALGL